MSLKPLPSSTVKLLGSAQVITSVSSAVKELIENSLDAGSDCIEVKLENCGLDRLEVRDNGNGISVEDVLYMCQRSYTSKISEFSDLDKLNSYGFRGEALSSLCAVGQVTVTTITPGDNVAKCYKMDSLGKVVNSTLSHITKGTIIVVENLFRNLPVRRQLMSTKKKKSDELKKTEAIVKCLAIIHPRARMTLAHNKFCIWQKNKVATLRQSLVQAIPPTMVNQLHDVIFEDEEVKLHMMIPRKDCNVHALCFGNLAETFYLFINGRPVRDRLIDKAVQESMFQYFGHYIPSGKLPMCLVSIVLPSHALDVNVEPNKTKVIIKDMDGLIRKLKDLFLSHYVGQSEPPKQSDSAMPEQVKVGSKRKIDDESESYDEICKSENQIISPKLAKIEEISEIDETGFINEQIIASTQLSETSGVDSQEISNKTVNTNSDKETINSTIERSIVSSECKGSEREKNVLAFLEGIPVSAIFDDSSSEDKSDPFEPVFIPETTLVLSSNKQPGNQTSSDEHDLASWKSDSREVRINIKKGSVSDDQSFIQSVSQESGLYDERNNTQEMKTDLESISSSDNQMTASSTSFENDVNINNGQYHEVEKNEVKILLSSDTGDKNMLNTDDVTLSQWSRGAVTIEGETVDGPSKFCGHENNIISKINQISNSDVLERSVSSQMGCKEMSAFTKFAREMRSKITQQAPGMSFTKVASELASRWKNLQDEEKEKYNMIAKEEKNKKMEEKKKQEEKIKLNVPKLQLMKEKKPSEEKKVLKKRNYCKSVSLDVSMDKLKVSVIRRQKSKLILGISSTIGKLNKEVVFCRSGREICALSLPRLKESLLFFDNLANMIIPLKVLEENIVIKEDELGNLLWNTLCCLETSVDINSGTIVVSDERITKNGFRIEVVEGADGRNFHITDVPTHIAFYGIGDLKEILEVIENNSLLCNLESCRPLKAISYIRSETIRLMAKSESQDEQVNTSNIINYWFTNVKATNKTCPHHKEVVKTIHTI